MEFSWNFSVMLLLFMVESCFLITSTADPRTTVAGLTCNPDFAANGAVLADYFIPAMANLSTQININGFAMAIVGTGPNMVYGLSQCYGDLDSIDCRLCFGEVRSLLPKCYPRTGGRIFFDGCFGRYENYSFYDQAVDPNDSKNCSSGKNSSTPLKFRWIVSEVIGNVSLKAQSNQGFAVGSLSDSGSNLTVYAMAQCWKNLNTSLCKSCLDNAASSIILCSPSIEARALNAGCYLRYSTRLFWNLNPKDSQSSWKTRSIWIILGSAVGGVLLITGVVIWKMTDIFSRNKQSQDLYGSRLPSSISRSKLNFRYGELKKATGNFDLSNKLGQGGYGSVFKGVLTDGREVAIKRLFLNTRQWVDQFFNEVNLINRVRHKNLVKLLGCSVDGPESLLIYEYYFNKSLDQFIFDPDRAKLLDWQKRFDIIQGVAEGLSYLHNESEIRIIHRDIKASNILLDEKLKPKITDFGLARSFPDDQTHLSTGIAGTLGYMAPEYVIHGHLTEKADVYSFGVLILEIVTGQRCSNGMGSQAGQFFLAKIWSNYKENTVEKIIDENVYNESVKEEIFRAVHVGLMCTQATPSLRPPMVKVVEMLRRGREEDEEEILPTDPPFLDVVTVETKELDSEGSRLLLSSSNSVGPCYSSASESGKRGR